MTTKYLLIGGDGVVASALKKRLLSEGAEVFCTSRSVASRLYLDLSAPVLTAEFRELLPQCFVVFLAAISSPDVCSSQFEESYSVNVTGTTSVIDEAVSCGARVLFFSSDVVYGERSTLCAEGAVLSPVGPYGEMKHQIEERYAHEQQFKAIRLSYVLTPQDRFVRYLSECAAKGREAEIFHPFTRNVVSIDDVVESVIKLEHNWNAIGSRALNVGGPAALGRREMASLFRQIVAPQLSYEARDPGREFWLNRPREINLSTELMQCLLGRSGVSFEKLLQKGYFRDHTA